MISFGANVDIIATPSSGTYHSPIQITLIPTEWNAKTFYSFKPDGYPQEAFLYKAPILLKHSSPFIYFSILNTENESKIKQNNYILDYPNTITFDSESISGSGEISVNLINNGWDDVDIGFWYVQSLSDMVVVPAHTILHSGKKYEIIISYPGNSSIVLRSPDDDERDILIYKHREPQKTYIVSEKQITTKIVPREIIVTNIDDSIKDISSSEIWEEIKKVDNIPLISDTKQSMKASILESWGNTMYFKYISVFIILSLIVGLWRWFIQKQDNH